MDWRILNFESQRGEKPVEEFLRDLEPSAQAKMIKLVDLLQKYGSLLGMPYAKRITKELYELRIRGKEEIRVFYAFHGHLIYLLHGFKKKAQKTPQREIQTALKRFYSLT